MFYRKIYSKMQQWFDSLKVKKTGLVIKGLRQVGKTTIVKEFCKNHYKNIVYINFMLENDDIKKIFDGSLVVDRLIRDLSAFYGKDNFVPYQTVLIFDEIQQCTNAKTAIKAFTEDGRYDIIATGSLLGLRGYNQKKSKGNPTGFQTTLNMYPMDFFEFLLAYGISFEIIDDIKKSFKEKTIISEPLNNKLLEYYKEYLCVGGMPDVVTTFFETHNMKKVREKQLQILEDFKDDFGKHLDENENEKTSKNELIKIMQVYNSIPSQLAKENKKFQYSVVQNNAKAREYRDAITWLEEFGLIKLCYNLNDLALPLRGNEDYNCFKMYVSDIGLLVAMLDEGTASHILLGDLNVYKGAIFENLVADAFIKNDIPLYFYRESKDIEIDFVTIYNNDLSMVEVKATNGNTKSLRVLSCRYSNYKNNFKLIYGNVGQCESFTTFPLYMAELICNE